MENSYVFYQGKIVNENEVSISIRSKVFNYGLGCFEGIRAYYSEEKDQLYVFRLKDHYERFLQSCKTLNIKLPYTADDLCKYTLELLKKNGFHTTTYIRPVAYKGGETIGPTLFDDDDRVVIYCNPMGKYTKNPELKVGISSWTRLSDNMIPPRAKPIAAYLNSALASLEAVQNGYDEAVFLTQSGHVCEGPGENIFIVRHGKLITPPVSDCILEGITRETVMQVAEKELGMKVEERSISRPELYAADEIFFSGTAMEVTPVVEVDRRVIGNGHQGEICTKIKELFFGITTADRKEYAHYCTPVYEK